MRSLEELMRPKGVGDHAGDNVGDGLNKGYFRRELEKWFHPKFSS